jgi:hypothetical protein
MSHDILSVRWAKVNVRPDGFLPGPGRRPGRVEVAKHALYYRYVTRHPSSWLLVSKPAVET